MNIFKIIEDIEENIKYDVEYNHFYIIDLYKNKLYLKQDYQPKEILKELEDVDLILLDAVIRQIYSMESYDAGVELAEDRFNFKYLNKIVVRLYTEYD